MECSKCERNTERGPSCDSCTAQQLKRLADVAEWFRGSLTSAMKSQGAGLDGVSPEIIMETYERVAKQQAEAAKRLPDQPEKVPSDAHCPRCGLPATAWFPSEIDPKRVACCSSCNQLAHRHAMKGRPMKNVDEYADAGLAFLKVRPDECVAAPAPAPSTGRDEHGVDHPVKWEIKPEDLGLPPGTELPPPIEVPPPEVKLRPCVRCGATTQLWSVCSGDGLTVRACEPCYNEAMRRSNEAGSNPRVGYDWLTKPREKPDAG